MIVVLVAVFAAATALYAANATSMTVTMALADAGGTGMPDCDGCGPDGDDGPACDVVCTTPLAAKISVGPGTQSAAVAHASDGPSHGLAGRTGPPDPYPPRVIGPS